MTAALELRAPANLVSRRARLYWTVRVLPEWLVIAALEVLILVTNDVPAALSAAVVTVTVLVAALRILVMPQWRYRVHRWEISDTAVYTQAGWFTQERRVAPLSRVQTVDTERGPIEQLFGLTDVTVTTASAKGPLRIKALDRTVAEQIVAWLTERAERAGGDGT